MIVVLFLVVVMLGLYLRHRLHSKDTRAGLHSERPVFSVDPPTRRLGARKRERL